MRRSIVIVVVVIALVVGAVMYMNNSGGSKQQSSTGTPSPTSAAPASTNATDLSTTVTYSGQSFSPASVNVKAGGSITFKNDSSQTVQVDSDPHPVHTSNSELNVGTVEPGQSTTVTLTKTGSFGIHNHLNSSQKARITVE